MKHPGLINSISEKENHFEWSDENINKIKNIIKKYPSERQQSAVIPVLDLAQRQNNGFLTKAIIERVAETLKMSFIRVMEVASFYSMFNLEPVGKNFVQIFEQWFQIKYFPYAFLGRQFHQNVPQIFRQPLQLRPLRFLYC